MFLNFDGLWQLKFFAKWRILKIKIVRILPKFYSFYRLLKKTTVQTKNPSQNNKILKHTLKIVKRTN